MKFVHLFVFALGACNPMQADIRSEIGDGELGPTTVYPDEEINITLWPLNGEADDQLSISIQPDRTFLVKRYEVEWVGEEHVLHTHTLYSEKLEEEQFTRLRKRLSAYRPRDLSPTTPMVFPNGCGFIHDVGASINVSFQTADERRGSFLLQPGCDGESADKVDLDLQEILSQFPEFEEIERCGWKTNLL